MKRTGILIVILSLMFLSACGGGGRTGTARGNSEDRATESRDAGKTGDKSAKDKDTGKNGNKSVKDKDAGKDGGDPGVAETAPETEPAEVLPEGIQITVIHSDETSYDTEYHYEVLPGKKARLLKMLPDSLDDDLVLPEELDGYPVTEVGPKFMEDSGSAGSLTIPGTVTYIDEEAFWGLKADRLAVLPDNERYAVQENALIDNGSHTLMLQGIKDSNGEKLASCTVADGVERIGKYAFAGNRDLVSVTLPDSVVSIGDYAFMSCFGLTDIALPEGLQEICEGAFQDCRALPALQLPDSLQSMDPGALANCRSLSVSLSDDHPAFHLKDGMLLDTEEKVLYNIQNAQETVGSSFEIPEGIEYLSGVFTQCEGLREVTLPASLRVVGPGAFYGCRKLQVIHAAGNASPDPALPDGVNEIGMGAFYDCDGLNTLELPSGLTSIGIHAFDSCTNLTEMTIPEGITELPDNIFEACWALDTVFLPESLQRIGKNAFYQCEGLRNVTIPAGVTEIGEWAFCGCNDLTHLDLPEGITSIEDCTFMDCFSLDGLTIPDGVTYIGENAFSDCKSFTELILPEGVTFIGNAAFSGCRRLTSFTFPSTVTDIPDTGVMFRYCSELKEIELPPCVTEIGRMAFKECSSLEKVTIPEGVTRIAGDAFESCYSLKELTIPESVEQIGENAFSSGMTVHVTSGSYAEIYAKDNGVPYEVR